MTERLFAKQSPKFRGGREGEKETGGETEGEREIKFVSVCVNSVKLDREVRFLLS